MPGRNGSASTRNMPHAIECPACLAQEGDMIFMERSEAMNALRDPASSKRWIRDLVLVANRIHFAIKCGWTLDLQDQEMSRCSSG